MRENNKMMNAFAGINLSDYNYPLPRTRIAQYPLKKRDESKLLIYKNRKISSAVFSEIPEFLPSDCLMVYNETRVIQARLPFIKDSGAAIEIFCLEPHWPTSEIQQAFIAKGEVHWKCLVGNSKKWKSGALTKIISIDGQYVQLWANRLEKGESDFLISFSWQPQSLSFSQILDCAGIVPLPPYMDRQAEPDDKNRYQTIYAHSEGSVAAPTAGLHFTPEVMKKLAKKNIQTTDVTLHVGAGTFKPVSSDSIEGHEMHTEQINISKNTIEKLLENLDKPLIAVGTTTTRTLESLYWHGVKLLTGQNNSKLIDIKQWDPYQPGLNTSIDNQQALNAILSEMKKNDQDHISGQTQLMIVPGYRFRFVDILITNFHMPKSTLLLLVSAFIGEDWKTAYQYALNNDYRFLSYGDSCLFFNSGN